jgi:hypothetical protein
MNVEVMKIIGDINQINDVEELRTINSVLVTRVKALNTVKDTTKSIEFEVGEQVTWHSRKGARGITQGTLVKKNRTRCIVEVEGILWTVPFNMLEKVG